MAGKSAIEWTDATWNPTTGCTRVSAGCDNCYALGLANRLLSTVYRSQLPVVDTPENRSDPFAVRLWPDRLEAPKAWKEPRRIFVNSMSDLFHQDVPDEFALRCFEVMLEADHHVYQILTKRPARAARFIKGPGRGLFQDGVLPGHIWMGTSVESQEVDYRVRHLLDVPAAVRFLSCEPLIGSLDLSGFIGCSFAESGVHWVIVGGESGIGARPIHAGWVRAIRDECVSQGIPFFFKQWGGRTPKAGGRLLDGEVWDEFPTDRPLSLQRA